jgi:hypothetical protein
MVYYSLFNGSQMDSLVSSCWVGRSLLIPRPPDPAGQRTGSELLPPTP